MNHAKIRDGRDGLVEPKADRLNNQADHLESMVHSLEQLVLELLPESVAPCNQKEAAETIGSRQCSLGETLNSLPARLQGAADRIAEARDQLRTGLIL